LEKVIISEALENVLAELGSEKGIQASAIVSKKGLIIVSNINSSSVDREIFGAMVAMLTRSAVHTAKELQQGKIKYLLLSAKKGIIIITRIDANAILTVLADTNVDIFSIINEMKNSCKKIRRIISQTG
jgi:predicted regulator of Ras-like GTPase activity (Roadblock/LC7/MglB family)